MTRNFHIESFLEMMSVERGSSKNTLESYKRDLLGFVEFLETSPDNCTELDIEKYMQYLAKMGLKSKSRARKLSSIKQFFTFLYIEKIRKDNPAANVEPPKLEKSLPKYLSLADVEKLLTESAKDTRLNFMLELLYAAGLRVSELISLKKNSIRSEGGEYYVFVKGKGSKERIVPLGKHAVTAMENYLAENDVKDWLFSSGKSHITRQRFGQLLKDLALKAGLNPEKVSPHVIRHSFASHMLEHGADLRLVQELLGHEQIATTQIYTHIQEKKLHEVVNTHHPLAMQN